MRYQKLRYSLTETSLELIGYIYSIFHEINKSQSYFLILKLSNLKGERIKNGV